MVHHPAGARLETTNWTLVQFRSQLLETTSRVVGSWSSSHPRGSLLLKGRADFTTGAGAKGTWLLQTGSSQDRDLGSDPSRADSLTQAPDLEDLGGPPKSQVKTGLTGSDLLALVKDQA